jgi:putative ABC transport system ATP-binding protein
MATGRSLALRELVFSYPGQHFSLTVGELVIQPGESIALVGPSGSGKTTLLNLIAGILQPKSGTLHLGETVLSQQPPKLRREHRLQHIGMIFQTFELLDYLDVRDNILLQARLCKGIRINQELEEHGRHIADELGLRDKWRRNIHALSQGERQRVAVCRALLLKPAVVLADEPTGNLDPENKRVVLNKLIQHCRQGDQILVTVTHDHSLLPAFDRVIDMSNLSIPEPLSQ